MKPHRRGHRLFFALVPDPATRAAIQSVQRQIAGGSGQAVPADRLHATLLFLGNQSEADLARVRESADRVAFTPCAVTLDRCGYFPRPAVAWLGSRQVPPVLDTFLLRLAAALRSADISFDQKPWKLHVTLYRNLRIPPETIDIEPVVWSLNEFCLLESVQSKAGLQYRHRGHWPARNQP